MHTRPSARRARRAQRRRRKQARELLKLLREARRDAQLWRSTANRWQEAANHLNLELLNSRETLARSRASGTKLLQMLISQEADPEDLARTVLADRLAAH